MKKRHAAIIWARVSTQEQADAGNSLPAQIAKCERLARDMGIPVIQQFSVTHSGFNNVDECPEFIEMVNFALRDERIGYILVDKENRFARAREVAVPWKAKLYRHGIKICSADPSEPWIDPRTSAGVWIHGTRELMAEAFSLANREDTLRAMKHNIARRDPETGYCYKNGGVAPYPWETYHKILGKDRRGNEIRKALWKLNEEHARIMRLIIIDMKIRRQMSTPQILAELNRRGIPGPRGKPWSISTLNDYFREDRLLQLAGYGFWNRHDPFTKGVKYKPREEWIVVENAHPPVITEEEARAARAVVDIHAGERPRVRTKYSRWLLTGDNLLGEPFFTCKKCGSNVVSWIANCSKGGRNKYACGSVVYRAGAGCIAGIGIDQEKIEDRIITYILNRYGKPNVFNQLLKEINHLLKEHHQQASSMEQSLQTQLRQVGKQIDNLLTAISKGLDPELVNRKVAELKEQEKHLKEALAEARLGSGPKEISMAQAQLILDSLFNLLKKGNPEQRRKALRFFVRYLEWDPESNTVTIFWFDVPPLAPLPDDPSKRKTRSDKASGIKSTGDPTGLRVDLILARASRLKKETVTFKQSTDNP